MPLSDLFNITVSRTSPGVTANGFGVPLVLSTSAAWTELTRTYANMPEAEDDWAGNTPENLALTRLFSQSPALKRAMVGRGTHPATQKWAVGVKVVTVGASYGLRTSAADSPTESYVDQFCRYTAVASVAWAALTAYAQGYLATNDSGKLYICITAGTSAGAGGPTGTNADITDGTVHWMYAGTGGAGVASNDAIVYNLMNLANALAAPALQHTATLTGSAGSKALQLLGDATGYWMAVESVDTNGDLDLTTLTVAQTHADPGVATDLAAIAAASSKWYGLVTLFNSALEVAAAAAWVETNKKLYIAATADTAVAVDADSGASDIAHTLKTSSYARTGVIFHPAADEFADAASFGRWFPINPGGDNWRMKTLVGVTAKRYTSTQTTNLNDKYCNFYYELADDVFVVGGNGKVAGNEYIDVVRGLDWYEANLSARLANLEIQNEKVPFDDDGIAMVDAAIRAQNKQGINAGLIARDPKPTVIVPKAADVDAADKSARHLTGVSTTWTLAGAINTGDVTVNAVP